MKDEGHSILLIQFNEDPSTRIFYNLQKPIEAAESIKFSINLIVIMKTYENFIVKQRGSSDNLLYNMKDLLEWIDSLSEINILMYLIYNFSYSQEKGGYDKKSRDILKKLVVNYLENLLI